MRSEIHWQLQKCLQKAAALCMHSERGRRLPGSSCTHTNRMWRVIGALFVHTVVQLLKAFQTPKLLPQPQLELACGLWNWKPPPTRALLQSSSIPNK